MPTNIYAFPSTYYMDDQNLVCKANTMLSVRLCYLVYQADALSLWVKSCYLSIHCYHIFGLSFTEEWLQTQSKATS